LLNIVVRIAIGTQFYSIPLCIMHQLIASFLFQIKTCPLGSLGSLSMTRGAASPDFGNKKIEAPKPLIQFSQEQIPLTRLNRYVASKLGCDDAGANDATTRFFSKLKSDLAAGTTATLEGVGNFYIDATGKLLFRQAELPAAFLPAVTAERVVRQQTEHTILVGDKETTNTLMTEYFNEEPVKKDRWWIWAIILGLVAAGLVLLYLNDSQSTSYFGNAI
jgi:hypothetical protein